MKRFCLIIVCVLFFQNVFAQKPDEYVRGRVLTVDDVPIAGVHIQNLHNELYTTTNEEGYFTIRAIVGNTLQLTHIGMQMTFRTIVKADFQFAGIVIQMKEQVTELEGVEVSKYQTITAQDLGILQHKPVERTFNEKRLYTRKMESGGIIGLFGLVDAITGKTKMLKKMIANEKNILIADYIQQNMSEFLKKELNLTDEEIATLAYYVMEEPEIQNLVNSKDDKTLQFMLIDFWRKLQQELVENG